MPRSGSYYYPGLNNNIAAGAFNEVAIKERADEPAAQSDYGFIFLSGTGVSQNLYFKTEDDLLFVLGDLISGSFEGATNFYIDQILDIRGTMSSSIDGIIDISSSIDFVNTDKSYHINAVNSTLILSSSATSIVAISGNLKVDGQEYCKLTTLQPTGSDVSQEINWDQGNSQILILASASLAVTASMVNPEAGASYILKVVQNDSPIGVKWPANIKWEEDSSGVITETAAAEDIVGLFYDGTNFYGTHGQNYSS